jgi:Ca2+-transporting ATPase
MEKGDPDVMRQPPRPPDEPIINRTMRLGIVIQTITQTSATLIAFGIGLFWHLNKVVNPTGLWAAIRLLLTYDWRGVDVQTAETMAFVTLSLCELFRAYTVRSERISVFRQGVFSNRSMQYAVGLSILLLLLVVSVPFLQPIFNTHFLNPNEWLIVIGLALIPALSEELTKAYLRWRNGRSKE